MELDFDEMIDDIYSELNKSKDTYVLKLDKPILKVTSTNTFWPNAKKVIKGLKRPPEMVIKFLSEELNRNINWKSSNKNEGIVLERKVHFNIFNSAFQKFINNYVLCKKCKSSNTVVKKENEIRAYRLYCRNCKMDYIL